MDYVGCCVEIVDHISEKVIAEGRVISTKESPVQCITFDNINFFPVNGKNFSINEVSYVIPRQRVSIPHRYKVITWSGAWTKEADVYLEKPIDTEVLPLVLALSRIKCMVTTGSCSGHGIKSMWVTVAFTNFNSINFLLRCIEAVKLNWIVRTTDTNELSNKQTHICHMSVRSNCPINKIKENMDKLVSIIDIMGESEDMLEDCCPTYFPYTEPIDDKIRLNRRRRK